MRALRAAAHRRHNATVLVLAPTGKAVDVALREGAGDQGHTIAKALQLLRDNQLDLGPHTLVVIDEAAMVGTGDLRQLLTATTTVGAKTVLIGDQHQLAPVKARGGMFAQLCEDLPWTQHLSEVWRMRAADERAASLALRNGGPASVRRANGWYRTHDRLHCGDAITMAADVLTAYKTDTAAGKDALLLCDTTEMADALNQRLHRDAIDDGAPTVAGARGHRIAVGDLILSRHNDTSIPLHSPDDPAAEQNPVRNGSRWRVAGVDTETNRLAAERLDDRARVVFGGEYLREHITHGYAVTVHSAQGVTADTTHAVLGETTTRSMLYVAMTRGREANSAYIYERATEPEYDLDPLPGAHVMDRGTAAQAGRLARAIIANHDQPITAHEVAAQTPGAALSEPVRRIRDRRASTVQRRRATYQSWQADAQSFSGVMTTARERHNSRSRDQSLDCGIEM
jgi:ATP-dependent exoDNAse (exonuclease V) alpha subunit